MTFGIAFMRGLEDRPQTRPQNRSAQAGNALFLVLIAVVLFAALAYAITQSNRGGGDVQQEANNIAVSSIMQYTTQIRVGLDRMLLNGIHIDDISFDTPDDAGYDSDAIHEVFNPQGGGVAPPLFAAEQVVSNGTNTGYWFFPKKKVVKNVGSDQADTVAILTHVKRAICEQINRHITGEATIPDAGSSTDDLTGDENGVSFEGTGIDGFQYGCVRTTDGSPREYLYYHVVVER